MTAAPLTHSKATFALAAAALILSFGFPAVAGRIDLQEVIFAAREPGAGSHWYENFGYYAHVFSYRPGGTPYFHLYEIDADGTDLKQLTDGPYDDFEPTYLADGRILFCSSRCNRWVNCWYSQVAVLYGCDADGGNLHPISANIEHDNTPWPLPDGRVLYLRWEYVDRSRVGFHHLWTANPDGTAQMVYYGNLRAGTVMIDAKPIPGTENKVVAVFSPDHGREEHAGAIAIVTPKSGPDDLGSAVEISPPDDYRDPYPLSEDRFLVAQGPRLLVMNGQGETRELYRLPPEFARAGVECHEPRPLRASLRCSTSRATSSLSSTRIVSNVTTTTCVVAG